MAETPKPPAVVSRTILHHKDPVAGTDKLYVHEVLDQGATGQRSYVSWGRRKPMGRGLASKEVGKLEALRLMDAKRAKGYQDAVASEIGPMPATPLTAGAVLRAAEAGVPAAPAPAGGAPEAGAFVDRRPDIVLLALEGRMGSKTVGRLDPTADPLVFTVEPSKPLVGGGGYTVDLRAVTCSCPASRKPCKHLKVVARDHEAAIIAAWGREVAAHAAEPTSVAGGMAAPEPAADFLGGMTSAMGIVAAAAPPEATGVARIFAPYLRAGAEDDARVPALEALLWDESHARRIALGFKRRRPTLLFGPTGTGKTAMARAFAAMTNRPFIRVNMTIQGTVGDLLGKYEVREGETIWKDGLVTVAAKVGAILLIDEADHMDPSVAGAMFSLMEENGSLTLKEHKGEVIEPHPDFCVFITGNSFGIHDEAGIYHGAQAVNAALLARCGVKLRVDYPEANKEQEILEARGIPAIVAERVAKAARVIRDMLQGGTVTGAWGIRQSIDFAVNALDLDSFVEGFEASSCADYTRDEFNALWEAAQRCTGTAAPSTLIPKVKARRAA